VEREETITTPEGRRLAVTITGPEDGDAVIAHTGTPDDGKLRPETVEAGVQRGLRQVSYARPGYADSDRNEGRSVADCGADVETIADALGIERFHTMGWSAAARTSLRPRRSCRSA
jgi:pimeloyl-ACP methyl ester carboxylesterase